MMGNVHAERFQCSWGNECGRTSGGICVCDREGKMEKDQEMSVLLYFLSERVTMLQLFMRTCWIQNCFIFSASISVLLNPSWEKKQVTLSKQLNKKTFFTALDL